VDAGPEIDGLLDDVRSGDAERVEDAAVVLGLLLERDVFSRRSGGDLGDVAVVLGDHATTVLSDADVTAAVDALCDSARAGGVDVVPAVLWALGKSQAPEAVLAARDVLVAVLDEPGRERTAYQALAVVLDLGDGEDEPLVRRIAGEDRGDLSDLAKSWLRLRRALATWVLESGSGLKPDEFDP
jgi:hypothetical protein